MRHRFALAFACGAILCASAVPAVAGTLQVNPVLLEVNAGRRTATITVKNEEAVPVTVRAYALAWRQPDGDEVYEETAGVIVSPPIFTIQPGATQLIRVGLRTPSASPQAYRLIIEEQPEASPVEGIRVALRLNLPFYSMVPVGQPASLQWSAWRDPDGNWTLEAVNASSGYVRIEPQAARDALGLALADHIRLGTVLPGATRRWRIGTELQITDRARFQQILRTQDRVSAQASRD